MDCPCCSGKLLRHISQKGLYWYCSDCRQRMPVVREIEGMRSRKVQHHQRSKPNRQLWFYIPLKPKQSFRKTA